MANIVFGSGPNTPTGDLCSGAIVKLKGRVSSLESGGGGTAPSVAAPTITGNATDGSTLTATPARAGSSGKWTRDGVPISGSTGLTYVYTTSTDAGRYIRYEETLNGITAVSNAALDNDPMLFYATGFDAANATAFSGFEGWTGGSGSYQIINNDLVQMSGDGAVSAHAAPSADFEYEVLFDARSTGDNQNLGGVRRIFGRYTDANNNVQLQISQNSYRVSKVVGGVETVFVNVFGKYYRENTSLKMRLNGDYARMFVNGQEISESIAANGGLGFSIGDLPKVAKVALNGAPYIPNGTFPQIVANSAKITSIAANAIFVGPITTSNIDNTPGRQVLNVAIAKQGTVGQMQMLVVQYDGKVVQNWTTIPNGATSFTSNELPIEVEGTVSTVYIRDIANPSVIGLDKVTVEIQWHPTQMDFGINTQGISAYNKAADFVDIVKSMEAGVIGSGIFHTSVMAEHIVVTVPSGVSPTLRMPYADVGMTADGWPTKVPAGVSPWPADLKFGLKCTSGSGGYSPTQAGVFDVKFTPGLDWSHNGGAHFAVSQYNLAAGTAVITITPNVTGQPSDRIIFNSYNGVPNTFPPAGQRMFKIIKRGEDPTSAFQAATLESWKGLTSAAKTDNVKYRGFLRFMTNNNINRPLQNGVKHLFSRKEVSENRLGFMGQGGVLSIVDMLDACKRTRTNLHLNIPDTADPSLVLVQANYLYNNMPEGMVVQVEYSNEIIFNFLYTFNQTSELLQRSRDNGVPFRVQLSRDIKSVVAVPFASVFGRDNPRWRLIVGEQAAAYSGGPGSGANGLAELMDEGDLYTYARGACVACYVGNGFNYADGGSDGGFMSKASRDKAGVDDAGFLNDYFTAQKLMSDWTRDNYWNSFANELARYAAKKGLPRGKLIPVAYEYSFHHSDMKDNNKVRATGSVSGTVLTVTANNNGPIRVGDVLIGTGITTGTKVTEQLTVASGALPGKAGTYRVDIAHATPTASITITSSTNLYSIAAGELLGQSIRDPRAGAAVNYMDSWLRKTGGSAMHFDHVGGTYNFAYANGSAVWGYIEAIGREEIDEPYISTKRDMELNG